MKTKLFTLLLAVAASVGTILAWDYERVQIGDLYYNLDATSKTAEVTSQNSDFPYWSTTITTANIPAAVTYNSVSYSVTSIGYAAFFGCSGLTSVTIGNNVTSIGTSVFSDYSGLTSISVAMGNTVYDSRDNCNAVIETASNTLIIGCKTTTIPNSVTSIGDYAFRYCTGLTSVTIPNSVTSIGSNAFEECSSLTSITIPNSVTSIGDWAFFECSSLTSIIIPNSVTSIGEVAFCNCTGLTSIDVTSDNPNYYSEDGVLFNKTKTELIQYPIGNVRTEYTIPNSVTSIGNGAFEGCTGLTSITIPNSVTSIGVVAFFFCSGLTSITCEATTPPTCDLLAFEEVPKSIPLYVPFGSKDAYRNAAGWKDFTNIQPIKADNVDITTVEVVPDETSVNIAWPKISGAYTYELVIKDKNGKVVCTLVFDAEGRLLSIAFNAPARDNMPQQTQVAGFAFTVTGLNSGTTYNYSIVAKDSNGNTLNTKSGSFTTTGESTALRNVTDQLYETKFIRNGQLFIIRDGKTYSVTGQEVR